MTLFLPVLMLLACCPSAFALNPALDVSQYAHTAWRFREGFAKGPINAIAQTLDGYLWLGTDFGLIRFDGVIPTSWRPPSDQMLPSNQIRTLLAARDGTLWIGTVKGLASWKNGNLTSYPDLAAQSIPKIIEDHEGTIWGTTLGTPTGTLWAIRNGVVQRYGDGGFGVGMLGLFEDSKNNLWVGALNGLWHWAPGAPRFYLLPGEADGIRAIGEADDGALLVGWNDAISRFVDGKTEPYLLTARIARFRAKTILRDRDDSVWIATRDHGLIHHHQGRTDVFSLPDGLSAEDVSTIFEDREGVVWVATTGGLDRFRDVAVSAFTTNQGLSSSVVGSVLADSDGSILIDTYGGLNRWRAGKIQVLQQWGTKDESRSNRLSPGCLFRDQSGRIWLSTTGGIGYFRDREYVSLPNFPAGVVHSITEDPDRNLWIANQAAGLIRLSPQGEIQQIPWARLGHGDLGSSLIADPLQGGLWIGFYQGGLLYFKNGAVRASYSSGNGLGRGRINSLRIARDGSLWAATEGGLSRIKDGHISTLSSKNGLPCDDIHSMIEDTDSLWLDTSCGLVRVKQTDVQAWTITATEDAAARNKDTTETVTPTVFDSSDGVQSLANADGYSPSTARSVDGKLWFVGSGGVTIIDPSHLPFNSLPPPVHIEKITADRKPYDLLSTAGGLFQLPTLIRDLEIDYTALSMTAPEKVRFRYKLENWDRDWQEAGTRRQAFYENLPPGKYRFRVMACNNSGVWNEAGAFLDFNIPPMYYQTTWFRLALLAAFVGLLVIGYQLRLRQVAGHFNMRLEGRVAERTRIARDLHDTLLQSFQGVVYKFFAVSSMLPDKPAEAKSHLDVAINQATQAINEGRVAVQGLRSSTVITNDLAQAIAALAEEMGAPQNGGDGPELTVDVDGTHRDLAPLVRDEAARIAGEAVRNGFQHASATQIEVEIRYARRQLQLWIRDDGKGIDQKVVDAGGREGHFGLAGMRERAKLVGGNLMIWSKPGSGTEVELTIPAAVAYAKPRISKRRGFLKKKG